MEFTTHEIIVLTNTIVEIGENIKFHPLRWKWWLENERIVYEQEKRWIYELYKTFKQIEKSREDFYWKEYKHPLSYYVKTW